MSEARGPVSILGRDICWMHEDMKLLCLDEASDRRTMILGSTRSQQHPPNVQVEPHIAPSVALIVTVRAKKSQRPAPFVKVRVCKRNNNAWRDPSCPSCFLPD